MKGTNRCDPRLSSKRCSTYEDLRRLKTGIRSSRRNARNLYRAAEKAGACAALQNLEEKLKQTSVAHKLVCCAVGAHLTNQRFHAHRLRLAA